MVAEKKVIGKKATRSAGENENKEKKILTISQQPIEQEITQSYIDYAMSVIISRALPDTRDGLKPVLRRILYAMYDINLTHDARYRKSALVV